MKIKSGDREIEETLSKIQLKIKIMVFSFDSLFVDFMGPFVPHSNALTIVRVALADFVHFMDAVMVLNPSQSTSGSDWWLVFLLFSLFLDFVLIHLLCWRELATWLLHFLWRDWGERFEELFFQNEFDHVLRFDFISELPQQKIKLLVAFVYLPKTVSKVANDPKIVSRCTFKVRNAFLLRE